ncbi:MAG: twin transmembrane helix small protein [Pseudomonadota bacterium]
MAVIIILLAISTLAVLFLGLGGFIAGGQFNEKYGNRIMQARVALQAITVVLIMIALLASGSS